MSIKKEKINHILIFLSLIILIIVVIFIVRSFNSQNIPKTEQISDRTENNTDNLLDVGFCELVKMPEKLDGKTVRLNVKITFGIEGSWLSDSDCGVGNEAVAFSHRKEVWQKIEQLREQKNKGHLLKEQYLKLTGKFINVVYNERGLVAPFQFEIFDAENIIQKTS